MFYDFHLNTLSEKLRGGFCFSKVLINTSIFNTLCPIFFVKLNHLALGTLLDEFLKSVAVGKGGRGGNHLSINPASLILLKKNFSRILAHL